MGQYYKIVNLDRKQRLNPSDFGDGLKLMEFGSSSYGTLTALASLLVMDAQQTAPWAGTRVVISGDYSDEGKFLPPELAAHNLYSVSGGYHLENGGDDSDAEGGAESESDKEFPEGFRQPFETIDKDAILAQLKGLGVDKELSSWRDRRYSFLSDDAFVAEQPEDLFAAFDMPPCEYLKTAVGDLLTCLRMSVHKSDVSWFNVTSVILNLDPESHAAKSMTVFFLNHRDPRAQEVGRKLTFPATAKDIVKFFGIEDETPKLENKSAKRLT